MGQRQWAIRVSDTSGASPVARLTERHTWPLCADGPGQLGPDRRAAAGLVGGTEQVESLVRLRTAALEHEMAERREASKRCATPCSAFAASSAGAHRHRLCDVKGRFQEVNPPTAAWWVTAPKR